MFSNGDQSIQPLERLSKAAFLALVFSLSISRPITSVFGQSIAIPDLLFPLVGSIWLLAIVFSNCAVTRSRNYFPLAAYIGALLLAAAFSNDIFKTLGPLLGDIYLVGLAVLTINIVQSAEDLRHALLFWLAGTFLSILVGVATAILFYADPENMLVKIATFHYGIVPLTHFPRLSSTFISASMFCSYLTVSALFLVAIPKRNALSIYSAIAIGAGMVICLALTVSVALGGTILAAGCWFCWRAVTNNKRRAGAISLGIAITAALAFYAAAFVSLYNYPLPLFSFNALGIELLPSSRLLIWIDTMKTLINNPLIGIGPSNETGYAVFYLANGGQGVLTDAHNIFLSVSAQAGLIGLAALIYLCVYIFRVAKSNARGGNPIQVAMLIAYISAFLYMGLTGAFEDTRHLWVLIGFILSKGSTLPEDGRS